LESAEADSKAPASRTVEYILVRFRPTDIRDVLADGDPVGKTETILTLPTDYYEFSLSGDGYTPESWDGVIANTSADNPLIITFQ
jgi:hypothetical protein